MIFAQTFEQLFQSIPLSLLEVWGSFGYILGIVVMLFAYGGFTFQTGTKWALGREWQAWDGKAFISMGVTFIAVWVSGYIGSSIVLVPGAQTFESLKDLSVFLCITLFGYPALLVVPFAYGLSDFYEGIPLEFMTDWWLGYFINPSIFWMAHQLIGKAPDFKRLKTWGRYLIGAFLFMAIEPVLWGYICSGKFSTKDAYYVITPALFYTTLVTWCLGPFAMLIAYPIVERLGYFWASIPGHVKQRLLRKREWIWESGDQANWDPECKTDSDAGVPIRLFILAPFIITTLLIMGTTSYFSLKNSEKEAIRHSESFHEEVSEKINLKLYNYFMAPETRQTEEIPLETLLDDEPTLVFVVNKAGKLLARSRNGLSGEVIRPALEKLQKNFADTIPRSEFSLQFRTTLKSVRKLTSETWIIQAMSVANNPELILLTAMPESYYLAGVHRGLSESSLVFAVGLVLVLTVVGVLGAMVISPIRRTCHAAHALAAGDLSLRVPESRLAEMNTLAIAFNCMAESLHSTFEQMTEKENRINLAVHSGNLGIWEWNIQTGKLIWNDIMYRHYGIDPATPVDFETWSQRLLPEDYEHMTTSIQGAFKDQRELNTEFRVRWHDGSLRILRVHSITLRNDEGWPTKMIGLNYDITDQRNAEKELLFYRNQLEEVLKRRTEDLEQKSAEVQELTEKQAKSEVYEKIAQIFLSMRDYTNSPLQAQSLSIALLKKRCPGQIEIIENLEQSLQRISSINRILSRLESNFGQTKLMSEAEILEYLDKIEQKV